METTKSTDSEQVKLWNGDAGNAWVEAQPLLDRMFKPFEDLLLDAVVAKSAERVLDIGCGTGATTLAAARAIGAHCLGIDISEPMIAAARARAARDGTPASFVCADAQAHAFEPAGFDAIISRFGVMFFDDPVRAFANLLQAARDDAALCLAVWRSAAENPFMTTAERAAAPLLPDVPAREPGAPGQFAFAEPDRVRRILQESGWTGIDIQPLDVPCSLPEGELVRFFTRLGPLGRILQNADEQTRALVIERVRAAFDPYVQDAEVRFTAACWTVTGRAPARSAGPA